MDRLSEFAEQTGRSGSTPSCSPATTSCTSRAVRRPRRWRRVLSRASSRSTGGARAVRATMADGQTRWASTTIDGEFHSVFVRRRQRRAPYVVGVDVPRASSGSACAERRCAARRSASAAAGDQPRPVGRGFPCGPPAARADGPHQPARPDDFRWDDEARLKITAIAGRTRDEVGGLASVLTEMERKLRSTS